MSTTCKLQMTAGAIVGTDTEDSNVPWSRLAFGLGTLTLGSGADFDMPARLCNVAAPEADTDAVPRSWVRMHTPGAPAGADPTGATDSTAALQAALDNQADVYLSPGRYRISATLLMRRSDGRPAVLWGPPGGAAALVWHEDPTPNFTKFVHAQANQATIAGLTVVSGTVHLDGWGGCVTGCRFERTPVQTAILVTSGRQLVCHNEIVAASGVGINVQARSGDPEHSGNDRILGNVLVDGSSSGIVVWGAEGDPIEHVVIENNIVKRNSDTKYNEWSNVRITSYVRYFTVASNVIVGHPAVKAGISVSIGSGYGTIHHNVVRKHALGIDMNSGSYAVHVIGNTVTENANTELFMHSDVFGVTYGPFFPGMRVDDQAAMAYVNTTFGAFAPARSWIATVTERSAPLSGDGTMDQVVFNTVEGPNLGSHWPSDASGPFNTGALSGSFLVTASLTVTREGGTAGADELFIYLAHSNATSDPPVHEFLGDVVSAKAESNGLHATFTQVIHLQPNAELVVMFMVRGSNEVNFCVENDRTRLHILHLN